MDYEVFNFSDTIASIAFYLVTVSQVNNYSNIKYYKPLKHHGSNIVYTRNGSQNLYRLNSW
jgi:hypothetical protein